MESDPESYGSYCMFFCVRFGHNISLFLQHSASELEIQDYLDTEQQLGIYKNKH